MTDAVEMFCAACGKSFWIHRETYDEIAEKIGSSWEMDCPLCRKLEVHCRSYWGLEEEMNNK
jgi:hypothetical protein